MFHKSLLFSSLLFCIPIGASLSPKDADIFAFLLDAGRKEKESLSQEEKESEFKPRIAQKTFKDLVGNPPYEIEDIVSEVKTRIKRKEDINTYKIILHGPPGGGKTTLAEAVAGELGWDFYAISAGDLLTEYQGSANKKITELLNTVAHSGKRSVLFIDEIDGLANSEHADKNSELQRAIHALHKIDDIHKDLICILATNALDKLPTSLLSRFKEDQICLLLPDVQKRTLLFERELQEYGYNKQTLKEIVRLTHDWDCREIQFLSRKVIRVGLYLIGINKAQNESDENGKQILPADAFYVAFYMMQKIKPNAKAIKIILNYWIKRYISQVIDKSLQNIIEDRSLLGAIRGMSAEEIKQGVIATKSLIFQNKVPELSTDVFIAGMYYTNTATFAPTKYRANIINYFATLATIPIHKDLLLLLAEEADDHFTGQDLQELVDLAEIRLNANQSNITNKYFSDFCWHISLCEILERKAKPYKIIESLTTMRQKTSLGSVGLPLGITPNINIPWTSEDQQLIIEKELLNDTSKYIPIRSMGNGMHKISRLEHCNITLPSVHLIWAIIRDCLEEEGFDINKSFRKISYADLFFKIVVVSQMSCSSVRSIMKIACNNAYKEDLNVCYEKHLLNALEESGFILDSYNAAGINKFEIPEEYRSYCRTMQDRLAGTATSWVLYGISKIIH